MDLVNLSSDMANFISPSEKWTYDKNSYQRHTIPDWVYGGVMYQIFPERFSNGDSTINPKNLVDWNSTPTRLGFHGGDLIGVLNNLDHIESLGPDGYSVDRVPLPTADHIYKYGVI